MNLLICFLTVFLFRFEFRDKHQKIRYFLVPILIFMLLSRLLPLLDRKINSEMFDPFFQGITLLLLAIIYYVKIKRFYSQKTCPATGKYAILYGTWKLKLADEKLLQFPKNLQNGSG